MNPQINQKHVKGKAANSKSDTAESVPDKINLRNEIQEHYRSNPVPWMNWVYAAIDLPGGSRLLEMGSGTGALWRENAARVPASWEITLSDQSPEMLTKARSGELPAQPTFRFLNLDAQQLPFSDERFDAVLAIGLLDLVPNLTQTLKEVQRVLRPGGQFIAAAGGMGHLKELEELLRPCIPPEKAKILGGNEDRFGMENGEKILSTYFKDVTRRDYRDQLVFTNLAPILDYVLSEQEIVWSMPLDKLGSFVERVKRQMTRSGSLWVTVHKGVFVARKKNKQRV